MMSRSNSDQTNLLIAPQAGATAAAPRCVLFHRWWRRPNNAAVHIGVCA